MPDPNHIAVASALSPRFQAVLAKAWRFSHRFPGARFSIVHAGERTQERETEFHTAMSQIGIPIETPLEWREGEPAQAIVAAAREMKVDVLIAGALARHDGPHFLSSVARALLRSSPCSLLLLTDPETRPDAFERIVAITDFTDEAHEAFRAALALAEKQGAETLHVLSVYTPFTAARAAFGTEQGPARHEADEEELLERFVRLAGNSPVQIDARVIHSTTGMGASDFTKTIEADLLVVPGSSDSDGATLLPTYMDWVMQVIPCSVWVVKPSVGA